MTLISMSLSFLCPLLTVQYKGDHSFPLGLFPQSRLVSVKNYKCILLFFNLLFLYVVTNVYAIHILESVSKIKIVRFNQTCTKS